MSSSQQPPAATSQPQQTSATVLSGAAASLSEVDLSGDFDPEAFDRRMAEVYNDDYYAQEDKGFRGGADDGGAPEEPV